MADETSVDVMDPTSMSDADISAFFDKGTLPQRPETEAAGQPAEVEVEAEDEGSVRNDGQPASEQARQEEPKKHLSRAERRNQRLAEENRQMRAELERIRTEREPSARKETEPSAKTAERKAAPKLKDFDNWEQYEEARDKYDAEQRRADMQEFFAQQREESSKRESEAKAQEQSEKNAKAFADRAKEYRKTLKDDDFVECLQEVIEATNSHPYLAEAIRDVECGPQLVKHFADNPAELDKLKGMSEAAALRAIGRLEADPRFKPVSPKTKTAVKRTSEDIGGRGGGSDIEDEINDAIARGDHATATRLYDKWERSGR